MRRIVTPFAVLSAVLTLAACGQGAAPDKASDVAAAPAAAETSIVMPGDAPPQEEADLPADAAAGAEAGSCLSERGQAAADRLVQRCVMVSPATHPPCNVANPCEMIQGEIDRSCAMYGPDEAKPAECAA